MPIIYTINNCVNNYYTHTHTHTQHNSRAAAVAQAFAADAAAQHRGGLSREITLDLERGRLTVAPLCVICVYIVCVVVYRIVFRMVAAGSAVVSVIRAVVATM